MKPTNRKLIKPITPHKLRKSCRKWGMKGQRIMTLEKEWIELRRSMSNKNPHNVGKSGIRKTYVARNLSTEFKCLPMHTLGNTVIKQCRRVPWKYELGKPLTARQKRKLAHFPKK